MIMPKNPIVTETVQSQHPADTRQRISAKGASPARGNKRVILTPERENKKTSQAPRKRIRLTIKQAQFLYRIFSLGYTVEAAMDELYIWPCLLDKWLRQPRFNQAIEFKLAQFSLQTRINAVIFAPRAVRTLGYMFDTKAEYETKRKASVDLLRVLDSLKPHKGDAAVARGGAQVAHSGAPLAHNGAQGRAVACENSPKTAPNPRFQLEIAEND